MTLEKYEKDKKKTYNKVPVRQLINFNNSTQDDIKVSIVIPIFNVETYLPQCLDSILNQSLKEIEIICVNDGSTDNSLEILKEYLSKDERIKIIDKENAGYGHTMNIGMDLASGEYIGIVESDDFILPDMLSILYNEASSNNLDFVKSDYYRFFGEEENIVKNYFKIDSTDSLYNQIVSTSENHETFKVLMNTWTGLYKTSFLRENNIRHFETPGASYQDNGFWFKTFFYGKRVMFIPQAFYMYRRDNPNSSVKNKEKVYAMDSEYDLIYEFLEKSGKKDEFIDALTFAKYNNFHFTMDRIDLEFKEEFLKNTAKNFIEMKEKGEYDPSLLYEEDKNILEWIVEDTNNYYNYMYTINEENYEHLRKYLECRIDIKNYGSEANDVILIDCNDPLCNTTQPHWFNNNEGVGNVITSVKGDLNLTFKCVNDGKLVLEFKGLDYKDKRGNRIPLYIDYTEIIIDEENILTGSMVSWHDNPFYFEKEVTDGQIVNVQVTWLPLNKESNIKLHDESDQFFNILSRARIDIKNRGVSDNNIIILENNDPNLDVSQPSWFNNHEGIGTMLTSLKGDLNLSLKCINDGNMTIEFKGLDFKDKNGNRIPIFIDYTYLMIDGKELISGSLVSWHDNPYIYNEKVKDGQIINLEVRWYPLNKYSISYFNDNKISHENIENINIEELREEIENLKIENKELREFNENILNSNSWKLTDSLRKIKHAKK